MVLKNLLTGTSAIKKLMLDNKTILITGGTGSFGKSFAEHLLKNHKRLKKIIIFSRDEYKQELISKKLGHHAKLRFFLGDIRDYTRLDLAFKDVNIVVHAAALKQVLTAEYNPFEFIKTNIQGSQNVIRAAINNNIERVVALSTDKAASPINLYGATKLCADKLFVSSNNVVGKSKIKFAVVRYGNVFGSRGSVIEKFRNCLNNGEIPKITDEQMTRFNISLNESIDLVVTAIKSMRGGEIFVPKIKSYKLLDLLYAVFGKKVKYKKIGLREGEKIHEEMIVPNDSHFTLETKKHYIIFQKNNKIYKSCLKDRNFKKVKKNFHLRSDKSQFESIDNLKKYFLEFCKNDSI